MKQLKPITNKLLWLFALGQFGWSLLSGVVSNWMVYYYTGTPDAQNPNTGIFATMITQEPILFKLTLIGLVMAVGRIFDAITDPLIAGWSDRSDYKGGRRIESPAPNGKGAQQQRRLGGNFPVAFALADEICVNQQQRSAGGKTDKAGSGQRTARTGRGQSKEQQHAA